MKKTKQEMIKDILTKIANAKLPKDDIIAITHKASSLISRRTPNK